VEGTPVARGWIGVDAARLHATGQRSRTTGSQLSDAKAGLRRSAYDVTASFGGFAAAAAFGECADAWDRHLHELAGGLHELAGQVQNAARHYGTVEQRVARATAAQMGNTAGELDRDWFGRAG
jgi:uncharacterized protein YukE